MPLFAPGVAIAPDDWVCPWPADISFGVDGSVSSRIGLIKPGSRFTTRLTSRRGVVKGPAEDDGGIPVALTKPLNDEIDIAVKLVQPTPDSEDSEKKTLHPDVMVDIGV